MALYMFIYDTTNKESLQSAASSFRDAGTYTVCGTTYHMGA